MHQSHGTGMVQVVEAQAGQVPAQVLRQQPLLLGGEVAVSQRQLELWT